MANILEAINRLNTAERMQVLEYLCTALGGYFSEETPAWHIQALKETEERVKAGEEEVMTLAESKRRLAEAVYAR